MSKYHMIMQSEIFEKAGDEIHNELAREHNAVLSEFARSPRLQNGAVVAMQTKQSAAERAGAKERLLLTTAESEASWTSLGGHDAAISAEVLRHEVNILLVLTGQTKHQASDGYILWADAMRALVS